MTRSPTRYEARPTRMFGAATLWEIDAGGGERQVAHGEPRWCVEEARRRNEAIGHRASAAHDALPPD